MDRWLWVCPILGVFATGAAVWLFGFGWLAALGIAFLVSCPAIVIWTLREARSSFGLRDRMLDQLTQSRRNHG